MDQSIQRLHAGKQTGTPTVTRRNEVSILDDIMGDDDFGDLVDSDGECDEDFSMQGHVKEANVDGASHENQPLESLTQNALVVPVHSGHLPFLEEIGCISNGGSKEINNVRSNQSGVLEVGKTRYFVIKSLNHHNIDKSVEKGIWATQVANEPVLNEAFKNSKRVLLIFSVNTSGHFQGYAQMISSIGPKKDCVWNEANWGGSFKVEWIKRHDLPFQKTTHLRNPLNCFKPVKISRDCQELTEDIGAALCALIDEGTDKETNPRRYKKPDCTAKGTLSKGQCTERNHRIDGKRSKGFPAAPMDSHLRPWSYPFGFPNGHYQVNWPMVMGVNSGYTLFPAAHNTGSMPTLQCGRKRGRTSNKPEQTEKLKTSGQRNGISRCSGSYVVQQDDDFLNMTYEEYLRRLNNGREYDHYQGAVFK